jgi:hypothetical protein
MRGILTKAMMVVMTLFLLLPFGVKVKAANAPGLEVKMDIGFNNAYKVSFYAPVNLTIKNGYKDINGLVEVRVPTMDTKYESYAKSLSVQKGSEKNVTISVPVNGGATKYKVVVYDGEKEIYSEDYTVNPKYNEMSKFIGVLSDDFESLTYLNTLPQATGYTTVNELIKLDEKSFPENEEILASLDIIVINNFDSSKLNKSQYENLKIWVNKGGTLIIGTGINGTKTLGLFKDNFIPGTKGEVKKIKTSQIYSVATNGDNKSAVEVEVLDMNIENSSNVFSEGNTKMVQVLKAGKGVVGVTGFDLGLSPFAGWNNNSAFGAKLYAMVSPDLALSNQKMNTKQNVYGMAANMLNDFSKLAAPQTRSFYIILIIYILVVAPISYIILKKLDKRELMWITVPALAVVFGLAVYVSGNGTRLTKITTNMINIIRLDNKGLASEECYIGIATPKKMNLSVKAREGEKLETVSYPYYRGGDPNQSKNLELETRMRQDSNTIEFYNKSIFEQRTLKLSSHNAEIGKLDSGLQLKDGDLTGTIKNSTSVDFAECYLITPKDYYTIGAVKSGESMILPQKTGSYSGDINELVHQKLMNFNYSNSQNFNAINQKANMISTALGSNGNMGYKVTGFTLLAFSESPYRKPIIVNGKEAEKLEKTIITASLNISYINGDTVEYPMGFIPSSVLPGATLKMDTYRNMLMGNGYADILYDIDKGINIEEVEVDLLGQSKSANGTATLSIYNINKNAFEDIVYGKISGQKLKDYIDGENRLKLKISMNNGGNCQVPLIAAKGKVK